jgi:hypothetical protein
MLCVVFEEYTGTSIDPIHAKPCVGYSVRSGFIDSNGLCFTLAGILKPTHGCTVGHDPTTSCPCFCWASLFSHLFATPRHCRIKTPEDVDWHAWKTERLNPDNRSLAHHEEVLWPVLAWEGHDRALQESQDGRADKGTVNSHKKVLGNQGGITIGRLRELRDPHFFQDTDGACYLLYVGGGEVGIGLARLTPHALLRNRSSSNDETLNE